MDNDQKPDVSFICQLKRDKILCQIFQYLFENNICIRCIIRFNKSFRQDDYQNKQDYEVMIKTVDNQLETNLIEQYDVQNFKIKNNIDFCQTCMGILQNCDQNKYIQMIQKYVIDKEFEFGSFKLTLKSPLSCQLRFKSIISQLNKQFNEKYENEYIFIQKIQDWRTDFVELKYVYKWIVGDILEKEFDLKIDQKALFTINIQFEQTQEMDQLFSLFTKEITTYQQQRIDDKREKKLKTNKHYNPPKLIIQQCQSNVDHLLDMNYNEFLSIIQQQIKEDLLEPCFQITAEHENIMIMGRYTKYCRNMSQTKWVVDGKRLYEKSIEEEMAGPMQLYFKTLDYIFHSGGREDSDVRMLNNGRPFVLEMVNPKHTKRIQQSSILQIQQQINNTSTVIQVSNLSITDHSCFKLLKDAEDKKVKAYSCIIHSTSPLPPNLLSHLSSLKDTPIQQLTPLRVVHRRSLITRPKIIHQIRILPINTHYYSVFILSSAGTYIKEFIHGDLMRTLPNLSTLTSSSCDILQLDVIYLYDQLDQTAIDHFHSLSSLTVTP